MIIVGEKITGYRGLISSIPEPVAEPEED